MPELKDLDQVLQTVMVLSQFMLLHFKASEAFWSVNLFWLTYLLQNMQEHSAPMARKWEVAVTIDTNSFFPPPWTNPAVAD